MTFTEEIVEFLHDILYADGVPVGYKQQAHLLLDKYKEESGITSPDKSGFVSIYATKIFALPILLRKTTVNEICALLPMKKIEAIKLLRSVLKENGEMVTDEDISKSNIRPVPYCGLKNSKDIIDGWDEWKKIHH